uniref:Putative fatty acid desaturase n=1 Tax=Phlebotomus kandelakii TaxID=1109342 RepID=A0A6B2E899_9DIPT
MPPNLFGNTLLLAEGTLEAEKSASQATDESQIKTQTIKTNEEAGPSSKVVKEEPFKVQFVWRNIMIFLYLHLAALYGVYLQVTSAKLITFVFALFLGFCGGMGITAGAHRLWAHKSYKAKLPLRVLLMCFQSLAFQNHVFEWVRDHRVHHKFTDTNADPHNSRRGFFFSHMGWLMTKKHPDVKLKGVLVDMSDLEADPVVMFQKKYYGILMPIFCFIIPALIPYYLLGETFSNSWYIASVMRYVLSLHGTWLVNSAAHLWGMKPYDKNISPSNNIFVAIYAYGEGWHNYHHVFPWDYKTSEFGTYSTNVTTAFIDFFSKLGLAYDLKTVSEDMIQKRILRTGDGSHEYSRNKREEVLRQMLMSDHDHYHDQNMVWGWDDNDMHEEDKKFAKIYNKED